MRIRGYPSDGPALTADQLPPPPPPMTSTEPRLLVGEVQPAGWCAYAPSGVSVVVGRYFDGSGGSDEAYGPYPHEKAVTVAKELSGGSWQHMDWVALPLVRTPWQASDEAASDG